MAGRHQEERLEKIYEAVEQYPGERPGWIARLLGIERSQVWRSLPAMEDRGYYLSEASRNKFGQEVQLLREIGLQDREVYSARVKSQKKRWQ